MNAKYFANRKEGKNETKQKRETKTKLISKKKHKQTTYRLFTSSSTFEQRRKTNSKRGNGNNDFKLKTG